MSRNEVAKQEDRRALTVDLIERVRLGDISAWDSLLDSRRRAWLDRYLRDRLPRDDVDDAHSETWLAVYENLDRLRSPEAFDGWLRAIAGNIAARYRRERARERGRTSSSDLLLEALAVPADTESVERHQWLVDALMQIPPVFAEALVLHGMGWSYKQIAAKQHVSVATTGSRVSRARHALKALSRSQGITLADFH